MQIVTLYNHPEFLPVFFDVVGFEDVLPRPTLWQLIRGTAPQPPQVLLDQSNCLEAGVEKTWNALHFLFTGLAEGGEPPASYLLSGGLPIGNGSDAHALNPKQLIEFRDFTRALSEDELRRRYDPQRMTDLQIYPRIIWNRDGEDALDYVMEFYPQLRTFLEDAADEQQGCIIWIA
jgi:hypothetical protein